MSPSGALRSPSHSRTAASTGDERGFGSENHPLQLDSRGVVGLQTVCPVFKNLRYQRLTAQLKVKSSHDHASQYPKTLHPKPARRYHLLEFRREAVQVALGVSPFGIAVNTIVFLVILVAFDVPAGVLATAGNASTLCSLDSWRSSCRRLLEASAKIWLNIYP